MPTEIVHADLVVTGCKQLVTLAKPDRLPRVGAELRDIGIVEDGAFVVADGRLTAVGPRGAVLATVSVSPHTRHLDVGGAVVMPGFVDYTHTVFAEYRLALNGGRPARPVNRPAAASQKRRTRAGCRRRTSAVTRRRVLSSSVTDHNDRNKKRLRPRFRA
jgi:imidazolonepropionase-like amidohydrolase